MCSAELHPLYAQAVTPVPSVREPVEVTTKEGARLISSVGTVKLPAGIKIQVVGTKGEDKLEVVVTNIRGTVLRSATDFDDRSKGVAAGTAPVAPTATADQKPTADPSRAPLGSATQTSPPQQVTAGASPQAGRTADPGGADRGSLDERDIPNELGILANFRLPLSAPARTAAVQYAASKDRWFQLSRGMSEPLVSDVSSGLVDQSGWRDRLILATIFSWLGTTEERCIAALALRPPESLHDFRMTPAQEKTYRSMVTAGVNSLDATFRNEMCMYFLGSDRSKWPRGKASVGSRLEAAPLEAMLVKKEFCEALVQSVSEKDYLPGVFMVLQDLYKRFPQDFFEYQNLAIAMAIVYDVKPPTDWPHGQVKDGLLRLTTEPWVELFPYFVRKDRDKALYADIKTLPADILKFLVDAPIPISELEWASNNVTTGRAVFDKLYSSIRYDIERLRQGRFDWEAGPYSLESIKRMGGICTDQSYYCYISAKAKGLPSLIFTGIGVAAGHAWFGYLRADGWYMNAGRGDEPSGQAMDPQTWQVISDTQLAFISTRQSGSTAYQYSRNMLRLAFLPVRELSDEKRRRICRLALESSPEIPASWYAVAELLERDAGRTIELRSHYRSMSDQFSKQLDIWAEIQRKLARLEWASGSESRAKAIEEDLLRSRSDIALDTAREILRRMQETQDTESVLKRYRKYIAEYSKLGGMTFYRVAVPFVSDLIRSGKTSLALDVLRDSTACIPSDPDSPVRAQYDAVHAWLTKELKRRGAGESLGDEEQKRERRRARLDTL
ncbi:hypothetical protein DB346_01165 [Verrucomicrobia bacterium LW23]|nr:hypothetical protein DB346_01165 [Verrucomicrobia bacterium LW23]